MPAGQPVTGAKAGRCVSKFGDLVGVPQGQRDVVPAFQQPPAGVGVDLEPITRAPAEIVCCSRSTVTSVPGSFSSSFHSSSTSSWATCGGQQPALAGVAAEDVGEPRRDHDPEAVVHQRPDRVLARGSGAEVRAGDEHRTRRRRPGG